MTAFELLEHNALSLQEAVMSAFDKLSFVAFNPLENKNPIPILPRMLIAKIDEQIQLEANKDYTSTQHKWVTDVDGKQRKVEVTILVNFVEKFRKLSCPPQGVWESITLPLL